MLNDEIRGIDRLGMRTFSVMYFRSCEANAYREEISDDFRYDLATNFF
jgi:hypothetical protein